MKMRWRRLDGRDGHTVGRELLRELVGELPPIRVTERGKPYFETGGPHFSISHCENHVFCVVSSRNVGIDAEEMDRAVDPRLAARILSEKEMARYRAAADSRAALLRLWVQKECWAKLTGRGWGEYLRQTDFDPGGALIIDGCYVAVMEESQARRNHHVI